MVTDLLQVKGLLVMYGLPWLLTGAILAHELRLAFMAEHHMHSGCSAANAGTGGGERASWDVWVVLAADGCHSGSCGHACLDC